MAQNESAKANELNNFPMRLETDKSIECCDARNAPTCNDGERIVISLGSVPRVFKMLQNNKATGLDGISVSLLRTCLEKLSPARHLFQLTLALHTVPDIHDSTSSKKELPTRER